MILISSPEPIKNEWEILSELFRKGLNCFHLRRPNQDKKHYRLALAQIETGYHNRVVIHDFPDLVQDFGLKGLHLKESVRRGLNAIEWKGILNWKHKYHMSISTSIHWREEWIELEEAFDYAFLSPVFNSLSKKDYKANREWQKLVELKPATKAIALGGIDLGKIDQIYAWNYQGVAVLGSVWEEPRNAVNETIKLLNACRKYVHTC